MRCSDDNLPGRGGRRLSVILFLLLGIVISGCALTTGGVTDPNLSASGMFGADPRHSGTYEGPGIREEARIKWSLRDVFPSSIMPNSTSPAAFTGGVVYFATGKIGEEGSMHAVNAKTSQELWSFPHGSLQSGPAVAGELVYFGSHDGRFYAVRRDSGGEEWSFGSGGPVRTSPAVSGGLVFFTSGRDGYLYALDAVSGKQVWKHGYKGTAAAPAADGDTVYLSTGRQIFDTTFRGELIALDARTGRKKWQIERDREFITSPAIADGIVVAAANDGWLYACDAKSGKVLWRNETWQQVARPETAAAIHDGVVFYGSRGTGEAVLYAADLESGEARWEFTADAANFSAPTVAGGVVYAPAIRSNGNGTLFALDEQTGQELWSIYAGYYPTSPATEDGIVFSGREALQ